MMQSIWFTREFYVNKQYEFILFKISVIKECIIIDVCASKLQIYYRKNVYVKSKIIIMW